MVTQDSSSTSPAPQMRPDEMRGLAARLRARADSVLMRDQPHQQNDLRQAAILIEQLANLTAEILTSAAVIDGLTRLLELAGGA
jgi:signal transduction histidine kinase